MRCIADTAPGTSTFPLPEDRTAVTLRGFLPTDIPFVSTIVADALREHYDPSLYQTLSTEWPEGFLIAADPHDVPVGFLLGVSQVEREARVLMFAVDRRHRTQGIGTLLMDDVPRPMPRARVPSGHARGPGVERHRDPLLHPLPVFRDRPAPLVLLGRRERLPDGARGRVACLPSSDGAKASRVCWPRDARPLAHGPRIDDRAAVHAAP